MRRISSRSRRCRFLARAAEVYPDQTAIIHGARSWSYREFYARARRLASALAKRGIKRGDTVAAVLPNVPAMLEAHYGVAMAGAVLNTINTRLDAAIIGFTLDHGEAKVLHRRPRIFQGGEGRPGALRGEAAGDRLRRSGIHRRRRTARQSRLRGFSARRRSGFRLADAGRRVGRHCAQLHLRHHRRSQRRRLSPSRRLSAGDGNVITCGMGKHPVYLWTLPMFHCNGWCFPWTLVGGRRHACLPARGARRADLRRHRHAQGHASVRRADRDVDAAQRAGAREEAAAARRRIRHRRGAAAGSRARGDESGRLQRHPCLWPDRGLRSGLRQRLAPRMGRALRRRTGGEESAPGRALSGARRRSTCSIR